MLQMLESRDCPSNWSSQTKVPGLRPGRHHGCEQKEKDYFSDFNHTYFIILASKNNEFSA